MSPNLVRPESRVRLYMSSIILTLFLLPITVFAEDDQSIATLRRMGKAFTSISGKASPAVVAIRVTKNGRDDSRRTPPSSRTARSTRTFSSTSSGGGPRARTSSRSQSRWRRARVSSSPPMATF